LAQAPHRLKVDPDLAAHITVLHHAGVVLHGAPIAAVFPRVPQQDYMAALWHDVQAIEANPDNNPVYGILNYARVYAYMAEGLILSKDDGAVWAIEYIKLPKLCETIQHALDLRHGRTTRKIHLNTVRSIIRNLAGYTYAHMPFDWPRHR
jgi:hypothetical protein